MNSTIVIIGLVVAVGLSVVEEFRSQGQSLMGWAGIVGFGVLLLDLLVK